MKTVITTAAVAGAMTASILSPPRLLLVWNASASMPIGLYAVSQGLPKRGDLLVARLPHEIEVLAVSWGILGARTPVLKPVAAIAGDRVCRIGPAVYVNGRVAAHARAFDGFGRHLPVWRGCRRLSALQAFLLARHPDSFDSRYYGPVELHVARGIARPLLIFPR